MSHKPTTVADLGQFDALIDARSPGEFAEDHLPGAINCPVLDDEEHVGRLAAITTLAGYVHRLLGGAPVLGRKRTS